MPRNAEILLLALGQLPLSTLKTKEDEKIEDEIESVFEHKEKAVSVRAMISSSEPLEIDSQTKFKLSFNKLYESMIVSQHRESGTLLLYTLLHENQSFRTFILR